MKALFSVKYCFLFLVLWAPAGVQAQDSTAAKTQLLTLEEALKIALDNNFDIQLARVDATQATLNNTAGNAGMLPDVYAVAGTNGSLSNTQLELATGDVQNRNNALAYGLNGAIQLDWTLFDGNGMFIRKRQLEQLERMGGLALKQQLQTTIVSVIQAYAAVIRQQQQLVAIDTAMSLAYTRMTIAQTKFEIGSAAKTDYLQARVDYNEARAQYFSNQALLWQSKDSLMLVLGNEPGTQFSVADEILMDTALSYREPSAWMDHNFSMQLAREQKELSHLDLRLTKAAQLPSVGLSAAYNFNFTKSAAGIVVYNQTYGPQAALGLSLPIFSGGNLQRAKKIAQQEVFRQDLLVRQLDKTLKTRYRNAWLAYDNARKLYLLELENIAFAEENVMIQQARFRVGVSQTLELREAENSYVNALTRKVNAIYNLKITATRLLELENKLLQ